MKSGTLTLGAAGCSLAATGLPGTAGTACRAGTTAGRVGAGLGVGGGLLVGVGGGGVAEEEGTGSLLGKSGWAGGGGGGRLVVGGGGGLLVVGGGGLLVVGGGGGLLVVGGGGGGLLLTGAGAGILLTGAGLLFVAGAGLLLTVEGREGLLAGFCSTSPAMVLAGVPFPKEDPKFLIAGRPLFLFRSRNLSSSSVGGADCGPLKAGAFIGPLNV